MSDVIYSKSRVFDFLIAAAVYSCDGGRNTSAEAVAASTAHLTAAAMVESGLAEDETFRDVGVEFENAIEYVLKAARSKQYTFDAFKAACATYLAREDDRSAADTIAAQIALKSEPGEA